MHTPLFNKAKVTVGEYREKLIEHRSHLKGMWQEADAILGEAVHLKKYEHKADKVRCYLSSDQQMFLYDIVFPFSCLMSSILAH